MCACGKCPSCKRNGVTMDYNDAVPQWELDILGETRESFHAKKIKAEETKQRLERFTQFFGRVNSAFTFRKVTVTVENSAMEAPAWSGASTVTFNSRVIGDLNDEMYELEYAEEHLKQHLTEDEWNQVLTETNNK